MAATSAVCQLIMLKGSGSLAGMVGVGAAVCVAVLFLFSDIHKNRKILCGVFVVAVGLVVLFCGKSDILPFCHKGKWRAVQQPYFFYDFRWHECENYIAFRENDYTSVGCRCNGLRI